MHHPRPTTAGHRRPDPRRLRRCLLAGAAAGPAAGRVLLDARGVEAADAADHDDHHHPPRSAAAPTALCPLTGSPVPGGARCPSARRWRSRSQTTSAGAPRPGSTRPTSSSRSRSRGGSPASPRSSSARGTSLVGPIRSARNIDIGILGQFGTPLLAHVGGIQPVIDNIDASPVVNVDVGRARHSGPAPARAGRPLRHLRLDHSACGGRAVGQHRSATRSSPTRAQRPVVRGCPRWPRWPSPSPATRQWCGATTAQAPRLPALLRHNARRPEHRGPGDGGQRGRPVRPITYGPWAENERRRPGGAGQPLRRRQRPGAHLPQRRGDLGDAGPGRRSARPRSSPRSSGQPIALQPGQTWVELVPDTVTVTGTPPF